MRARPSDRAGGLRPEPQASRPVGAHPSRKVVIEIDERTAEKWLQVARFGDETDEEYLETTAKACVGIYADFPEKRTAKDRMALAILRNQMTDRAIAVCAPGSSSWEITSTVERLLSHILDDRGT